METTRSVYTESAAIRRPRRIFDPASRSVMIRHAMNYLSHARDILDRPYAVAGTALPDWLGAFDRNARIRPNQFTSWAPERGSTEAEILDGVRRHFADDAWFHATSAFHDVRGELTREIRTVAGGKLLRSSFFAHLLLEILLDASLIDADPAAPERYYEAVGAVDPDAVEEFAAGLVSREINGFAELIRKFRRLEVFEAYSEDEAVVRRLERVGHRVGLPPLPAGMKDVVARCRPIVAARAGELLTPP